MTDARPQAAFSEDIRRRPTTYSSVATLAASANRFLTRSGGTPRTWRMSMERVAASFMGDRMMRVDGHPIDGLQP